MINSSHKIGVVVAQLGTPAAPTAQALRPYLRQFLSDMRVIDYHPLIWQPILRGIILRTRPRKSAKLYQRIWMDEGSPLLVYSQQQVAGLQQRLGDGYAVVLGMTYGEPSMCSAIQQLEAQGIDRMLIMPMYPQYSSTTSGSVYDAAYRAAAGRRCPWFHERKRHIPTLRFVPPYYDHPSYIAALKARIEETAAVLPEPPKTYLFTFHGIPNRYIKTGDPYRQQCEVTAKLLAEALNLREEQYRVSFQSQFGPEKWLEPYTEDMITQLGGEGGSVLAVCPGFTADCLETLDEIGNEGRHQFSAGGGDGEQFHLTPCLNAHRVWLDAVAELVEQETQGWGQTARLRTFASQH